jgi:hypothetical protein
MPALIVPIGRLQIAYRWLVNPYTTLTDLTVRNSAGTAQSGRFASRKPCPSKMTRLKGSRRDRHR